MGKTIFIHDHEPAILLPRLLWTRSLRSNLRTKYVLKSGDGGSTFAPLTTQWRHVDDHALWIDPGNNTFTLGVMAASTRVGIEAVPGVIYAIYPVTQFYRIQPDYVEPFYNVCGGTQDNNSLLWSLTDNFNVHGITNSDWKVVLGGDGYEPQFDPTDPNIVYAQYQYGGLARYDRQTQERVYIVPHPRKDENNF